jgi:WD40 repeat protein
MENKSQKYHLLLTDYFHSKDYFLESIEKQRARAKELPPTPRPVNIRKVTELPWQTMKVKDLKKTEELFTNLFFLEAKTEAGNIFELLSDLRNAIKILPTNNIINSILCLLVEAIRRDIHFIDRHPTTLLQCLYNLGIWYASKEKTKSNQIVNSDLIANSQPLRDLSILLKKWLKIKKETILDFVWVRSLHPPPLMLESPQEAVFRGHTKTITDVKFSPDGTKLVSCSEDCTIKIWNVKTGIMIGSFNTYPNTPVCITFSLDGSRFLTGGKRKGICFDANQLNSLISFYSNHGRIRSVAFAPNGKQIAVAAGNFVELRDGISGELVKSLSGHKAKVIYVGFFADGKSLISYSEDTRIRVWNLENNTSILYETDDEKHSAQCFSHNSKFNNLVAYNQGDNVIIQNIWKKRSFEFLEGLESEVNSLNFSGDGSIITAVSDYNKICSWNLSNENRISSYQIPEGKTNCIGFSNDGQMLVTGGFDGVVRIWNIDKIENTHIGDNLNAAITKEYSKLKFSPDGELLVTIGNSMKIWNAYNGILLFESNNNTASYSKIVFSPDSKKILTVCIDDYLRLWDSASGNILYSKKIDNIASVSYSPNGDLIAVGVIDIKLIKADGLINIASLSGKHLDYVSCIDFSSDGKQLISGSYEGSVVIWELSDHKPIFWLNHGGGVSRVAFYKDDNHFITIGNILDQKMKIWNLSSGQCIREVKILNYPLDTLFYEKNQWLIENHREEFTILDTIQKKPLAWYLPLGLNIDIHPFKLIWARIDGPYLYHFVIDGIENDIFSFKI